MVETDVRRLFWNQWTIMGSTMGNDAEFDAVADEFARRPSAAADRLGVRHLAEGARRSSDSRVASSSGKSWCGSRNDEAGQN